MTRPSETAGEGSPSGQRTDWKRLLRVLLLILAGFWIYWPALHGGWLPDDDVYLPQNPLLGDPARLWKIWFVPGSFIEYYPVEATFQWLLWSIWGEDTAGYHVVNLLLHLASAFLLWRLFGKLGLRLAWLGALLFVLHPAQVESVATIAELKNTLSLPPLLLAMGAWIDYEERGGRGDYLRALGFFLLAMLGKISMAPFPAVILLYAWWKRGRLGRRDLAASAPFFALSLALVMLTILCGEWFVQQRHLYEERIALTGFTSRLALGGETLAFYFARCFWPAGLLPIYPQWNVAPSPSAFIPWLALAGAVAWLWTRRKTWGRHALLGLGFFLLMIAPFLGLNTISYMSFTWVTDHLLYIAIIGPIGLVTAAAGAIGARLDPSARPYAGAAVAVVALILAVESRDYASKFTDQETLWTYTLDHNPGAWAARNNLGSIYLVTRRTDEAIAQYRRALLVKPTSPDLHTNLGLALMQAGDLPGALDQFNQALQIWPGAAGHVHLGDALIKMGRAADALAEYRKALALDPANASAHAALGNIAVLAGRFPEAKEEYLAALRANPGLAAAHSNLGNIYFQAGQIPAAIGQYELALSIDPNNADTHCNLGSALVKSGRISAAIAQYQAALEIDPNLPAVRAMLERLQALPASNPQ